MAALPRGLQFYGILLRLYNKKESQMEVRYTTGKNEYRRMTTEELRAAFLNTKLYEKGKVNLMYCEVERGIAGFAVPTTKPQGARERLLLRAPRARHPQHRRRGHGDRGRQEVCAASARRPLRGQGREEGAARLEFGEEAGGVLSCELPRAQGVPHEADQVRGCEPPPPRHGGGLQRAHDPPVHPSRQVRQLPARDGLHAPRAG